jgi:RNA polymerase sigma-70 factor (ECF subfamily)
VDLKNIISGCKRKDAKAQKALVLRYAGILMTVGRRYTKSEIDAEDILQDAFILIFQSFHQFDPNKGTLESWMRKIVVNTALKSFRKKKSKIVEYTDSTSSELHILPGIYEKLHEEELIQVISELPEGYRQVFNLYAIEGYSHKEISSLLNIEEVSSRSRLSRARKLLQERIKKIKKSESWVKIG